MRKTLLLSCALAACSACSGDDNGGGPPPGSDGGADGTTGVDAASDGADGASTPQGDAGPDGADGGEGGVVTGVAYVRVANLSPDALPFDVCFSAPGAPSDFSQSQPFLKAHQPAGVTFLDVSAYFATSSGKVGARLVGPGAADCSTEVDGLPDRTVTLASQGFSTVLAQGLLVDGGATPLAVTVLPDDPPLLAIQEGGMASLLRVVDFAPGEGTLDVGTGDLVDGDYAEILSKLTYGVTPAPGGGVDANGYLYPVAINGDRVSVHVDGASTDLAVFQNVTVNVANIATLFLAPGGNGPSVDGGVTAVAINGVLCANDYAQATTGGLNPTCAPLPQ